MLRYIVLISLIVATAEAIPRQCTLPITPGPCRASISSWGYDVDKKQCVHFIYGGCQGNKNRFSTEEDCEKKCEKEKPCQQPIVPGPCRGSFPSWGYSTAQQQCIEFIYGGCQGNDNRFSTEAECEKACEKKLCQQTIETGPCEAYIPSYGFDTLQQQCVQFIYGGCQGNDNRFTTEAECKEACEKSPCEQPIEIGPCDGYYPSYGYSTAQQKCIQFIYGGCEGNDNRFTTEAACQEACENICTLPAEPGLCKAAFLRWFYNTATNACEQFTWGGCGGNANNFVTQADCQNACP